jgi:uncharacterized protein YdaU (DUF1376 family)
MDAYYANEEAPPAEDVYVIGRATTPVERKNVEKALTKFELRNGRYYHKRVEEELNAYRERSKTATKNVEKRYQKPTESTLASSHKPVTSNQNPEKRSNDVGDIPPQSAPLAALAAVCLASRVNTDGTKALMHLRQFTAEGVTDQQLRDAIAIARERKPEPEALPLAYLAPIIVDLRAGRIARLEARGKDAIAAAMTNIAAEEARNAAR